MFIPAAVIVMNRRSDVWKMTQSASIWGLHVSHECVCNAHLRADSLSVQFYRENTWRLISTTSSVQWAAPQSHPAPDKLPCRGEQGRPRCSHRPAWRWGDLHLWLPRWPPVDCLTDRHKHNYKTVHVFHAWAGLRWSLCHQHLHIWIVHDVVAKGISSVSMCVVHVFVGVDCSQQELWTMENPEMTWAALLPTRLW